MSSARRLHIDEDGRIWRPFSVSFQSGGKTFQTELWAMSEAHSQAVLADFKATAALAGRVVHETEV